MRLNFFSRLLIILVFITSGITATHAADALDDEINGLTALPVIETLTGVTLGDGSTGTVTVITDPVTGNSAGRATREDKSWWEFTRTTGSNGNYVYTTTENGVTQKEEVKKGDTPIDPKIKATADVTKKADAAASTKDNCPDGKICTITSEKVPGADCKCYQGADCSKVETRKYMCTTSQGLSGFQDVFAKIIRYVINIVLLLGVLAVVGLGIAWSFAGGDDVKAKSTLKTWAINIIIGLLILFMFSYILRFLAPWVYR